MISDREIEKLALEKKSVINEILVDFFKFF